MHKARQRQDAWCRVVRRGYTHLCARPCTGSIRYAVRGRRAPESGPDHQPPSCNPIPRSDRMDIGTTLLFSTLFGSIGLGYFMYGKKQQKLVPLVAGIVLCAYPYFMSNVYALVGVGIVVTAVPWFLRL